MKVCFVLPTLTGGGAERVAVTVLSALDGEQYERLLYLFNDADAVYLDRVAPGVRVVVAARHSRMGRLVELARFVRSARPDVVMPFLSYFTTVLAVWLSGVRARVIFNQGTPMTGFLTDPDFPWHFPVRRHVFAAATRWFYRRADAVVVTSQGVADDLADHYGVPRGKLRVLHNPVDLDAIAVASLEPAELETGPILAAAGRLAGVKNYPLLFEAISRLCQDSGMDARGRGFDGMCAWILGDGPDGPRLTQRARELGIGDRVRFLGFQHNPWRFIARADVFVLTSTYEGFGNVLIEAMACGTPVVATRSPGTEEIIEDGTDGLLVDHNPAAVADAIRRVLVDAPLRARLATNARRSVQQYATASVAARYERLLQELAA